MTDKKSPGRRELFGLYPIIDLACISPIDAVRVAGEILEAGIGSINILQLRAKDEPARAVLKTAKALRRLTLAHEILFIVNDRIDIALMSRADGVHLGLSDIPIKEARGLLGTEKIIGVSTHNIDEAKEAVKLGADYISFGPIFNTRSKPDAHPPGGISGLASIANSLKDLNTPIAAIGGITKVSAAQVIASGASMAAVISEILLAGDIGLKVKELIKECGPTPPAR